MICKDHREAKLSYTHDENVAKLTYSSPPATKKGERRVNPLTSRFTLLVKISNLLTPVSSIIESKKQRRTAFSHAYVNREPRTFS
jgi:hypothetical protein